MIRHITNKLKYNQMLSDGILCPRKSESELGFDNQFISFEEYFDERNNLAFFKAVYLGKNSNIFWKDQYDDLVGIIFDDEELALNGFEIISTNPTSTYYEKYFEGKPLITKYENYCMVGPGGITSEEYNAIGNYIFVKGEVPTKYIRKIEEWSISDDPSIFEE